MNSNLPRVAWHGLLIVICVGVVTGGGLAVVTSSPGISTNNVDEISPQSQQQQLEIKYDDGATGTQGSERTSESLVVTVTEGSVTFGPESESRLRVRDVSTGETLTLEPSANTQEITFDSQNDIVRSIDIEPPTEQSDPPARVTVFGQNNKITGTGSGDTDIFRQQKLGPFKIQVINQDGDVRAETDPAPHGVYRPDLIGEINDTAVAIERPSDYNASFNVRFYSSFDALVENDYTELTNQQGAAFFRGEVQDVDDPIVRVFPSETSPDGQRIADVSFSLDRVEGPAGAPENETETPDRPDTPEEPDDSDSDSDSDSGTSPISRSLSTTEVAPGETATLTTEITGASGSVSTSSSYDPQFSSATVQSVTVNGASADPIISEATVNGSTVTLGDVGTDATVTITEELTVGEELNVTHTVTGDVTVGGTTTDVEAVSVTVADIDPDPDPQSPVDEFDEDGNGNIEITELGQAGQAFASGDLTITELGQVGAAFAS